VSQKIVHERAAQSVCAVESKTKSELQIQLVKSALKQFDDHPFYKDLVKYAIIPAWEENRKAKKENREIQ
jgi:hypothetical protein